MKPILILIAFLIFASLANAQEKPMKPNKEQLLPVNTQVPNTKIGVRCCETQYKIQIDIWKIDNYVNHRIVFNVIDGTKKVIDTVYSTEDNMPMRTIQTKFESSIDRKERVVSETEYWDDKLKKWDFYSISISPYKSNKFPLGTGISILPYNYFRTN